MAILSQHPAYSKLPKDEHEKPRTSPRPNSCLSVLTVLACLLLVILSGSWTVSRFRSRDDAFIKNPELGSKALVISSMTSQDVSWLDKVPSDWQIFRYFTDDPHPPNNLSVPRNQGREAMVYLTYIIDHYHNLPDYIAFVHGHQRAWHQVEPISAKIRALNLTALAQEGYISFRCGDQMGCEKQPYLDIENVNWDGELYLHDFWKTIMPHEELPRYISYKCCGQHATTRATIQRHSLEDWIRIRSPMLHDPADLKATVTWATDDLPAPLEWLMGTFYEKLWHILLGQGGEYCPSVEHCRQVHFSNAIACVGDIDLTLFDGDGWKDTLCATAFDELHPDETANFTEWESQIGLVYADLGHIKATAYDDTKNKLLDAESKLDRLQELEEQALAWDAEKARTRHSQPLPRPSAAQEA